MLSLLCVGGTLWVTSNLQGGAATVNEAGRLRMLTYRLALMDTTQHGSEDTHRAIERMQTSINHLRPVNSSGQLFTPWDATIRQHFFTVDTLWQSLQKRWLDPMQHHPVGKIDLDNFVNRIDAFVAAIVYRLNFWTSTLHLLQSGLAALVIVGAMLMFYTSYIFVLNPVGKLSRGVSALEEGDYSARVEVNSTDELGDLAQAFNRMADQLQTVHAGLEDRVRQKTADLQAEQQRLTALYEVSALVSKAQNLDELAQEFIAALRRLTSADAALLRWTDDTAGRYLLLAAEGMPQHITDDERCLMAGNCHCGQTNINAEPQTVQFREQEEPTAFSKKTCVNEGFSTLLKVPVTTQDRLLGEIDLLYRSRHTMDQAQRSLLEALAAHLAAAMESLRSAALERESVLAKERSLLARELHDSIAQALAFMKIQLQLLRSALKAGNIERMGSIVNELDTGVRESLADVRELLLHFRTRTQEQDIEPALRSTLQKFELQSGVPVHLQFDGFGQPLDSDIQVQVLHVLQEALSNIRKHAQARHVDATVSSMPQWRFEIRDDGCGFNMLRVGNDTRMHVGLQIMRERAATIGARLLIESHPGSGTCVTLELPESGYLASLTQNRDMERSRAP
ncbi:MAG: type IV pili methyl-accepting chemotaxis transducer N-terminal domain-containing protein [Burkholderiales bacterium]